MDFASLLFYRQTIMLYVKHAKIINYKINELKNICNKKKRNKINKNKKKISNYFKTKI